MSDIKNLSLSELAALESFMPEIGGFPSRVIAQQSGYDGWLSKLYQDLDIIIKNNIYPSASYRQNDKEDRFNLEIANSLKLMGYKASHDSWQNGHPDILVESPGFGYKWTGESKIHSDYNYLLEGFKQLCERYTSGFSNENKGAIFIITKNLDVNSLMKKWKKVLSLDIDYQKYGLSILDCTENEKSFISTHTHNVSGNDFEVRHIPISIRFQPNDKSARNRKS